MLATPKCYERGCKHFRGVKSPDAESEAGQFVYCEAFPNGIPNEIAYGDNPHTSPFPGDHGIQFEKENSE